MMDERPSSRAVMSGAAIGLALWAGSAVGEPLTLVQAVERGIAHYPSIQASLAEVDLHEAALGEAEAKRFPVVSLGAAATRYQDPTIVHPIHAFTPGFLPPFDRTLFQLLADLDYTLFDGGARRSRIDGRRAGIESAQSALAETRQKLLAEIVRVYLGTLGGARTLEAQERSIAALESERGRVRQLLDVGRAAQVDLLRVEAAIASAQAEKVRIASALDLSERSLARLIGASVEETRAANLVDVTTPEDTVPARSELLEQALANNVSVQRVRDEVEVAAAGADESSSRRLPTVSVDGRYINYGSASGANSLEWNVGLSVSYPLFTGGEVGKSIARSQAAERSARERVKWMEAEVSGELDRSLAAVEEAVARMEALETAVNRYAEVSRIEKLRLETGAGTETDYVRAEADLALARASFIESRYAEISARCELARVTGSLSADWLQTNLRSEP